ncbi:MAG: GIN domain-containing protein [Chitinophagaceae bacterium]
MKSLLTFFSFVIVLSSCKKEAIKYTTKDLPFSNFSKLDITNNFEIQVTKASNYSVQVTGKENDIQALATSISNGELKMGYPSTQTRERVLVKITMPSLLKFNFSTNSHFTINGFTETEAVEGKVSSNTEGFIQMNAPEFNIQLQNRADVIINGSADKIKSNVLDYSNLNTYGILAKWVEAIAINNSKIKTYTNTVLNASSSGSSIIYFKGNPGSKFLGELDNSKIIEQ